MRLSERVGSERQYGAMAVYSQADLDSYFADMEHLLAAEQPVERYDADRCVNCGSRDFCYGSSAAGDPGARVCNRCGVVAPDTVYYDTMYGHHLPTRTSNYKRIHHWHERISQLLLMESRIPNEQMLQIGERLCDGSVAVLNKDAVRAVLRSLNMQQYIEKWLQIIHRITGVAPPLLSQLVVRQLDTMFVELQRPFEATKTSGRKNFINYNYVFCRLLQQLDCERFCMFFPLIKSKSKLRALDEMWARMTDALDWTVTPLRPVAPFAVKLDQPELALANLRSQLAASTPADCSAEPLKTGFRTWGPGQKATGRARREEPRSYPPARAPRKAGPLRRRLR